jgi:hypothetical protein
MFAIKSTTDMLELRGLMQIYPDIANDLGT